MFPKEGVRNGERWYNSYPDPDVGVMNFYILIWETQTECVAMVTDLFSQDGVTKAPTTSYFPMDKEPRQEGPFVLTLKSEQTLIEGLTLRVIQMDFVASEQTRTIKHYWLQNWPDQRVPKTWPELDAFMKLANCLENEHQPLIHCRAGIGQTGVLFLYLIMVKDYNNNPTACQMSIKAWIQFIRQYRYGAIQTPQQVGLHFN